MGKKLFGRSCRGLTGAHGPPPQRPPPQKTLAVVLVAELGLGGCAGQVSTPPGLLPSRLLFI